MESNTVVHPLDDSELYVDMNEVGRLLFHLCVHLCILFERWTVIQPATACIQLQVEISHNWKIVRSIFFPPKARLVFFLRLCSLERLPRLHYVWVCWLVFAQLICNELIFEFLMSAFFLSFYCYSIVLWLLCYWYYTGCWHSEALRRRVT